MHNHYLPNFLFLTGVPGSKWSGIAQAVESVSGFNKKDRDSTRDYSHAQFSGHKGAYFGRGMEFRADLENMHPTELVSYLNSPWGSNSSDSGAKVIKSHDWAYRLPFLKETFPNDWIMLVYRPTKASFDWWIKAGGFNITYPSYAAYIDNDNMLKEIDDQNEAILEFGYEHQVTWSHFTASWVANNIGTHNGLDSFQYRSNILVSIVKP